MNNINLTLPNSWEALTPKQLEFFFKQLSRDIPFDEILPLCLCHWAKLTIVCHLSPETYLIKFRKQKVEAQVNKAHLVAATLSLHFLKHFPSYPIRLPNIGRALAIDARFCNVPFSTFIAVDNYYQGFLQTHDYALLRSAATLLYPRVKSKHLTTARLLNIFYWITSLKQFFAQLFPNFLTPAPAQQENLLGSSSIGTAVRQATNAQIRALTAGDITKEAAVLAMDTWRALTELDAKAKDVEDLKKKHPIP